MGRASCTTFGLGAGLGSAVTESKDLVSAQRRPESGRRDNGSPRAAESLTATPPRVQFATLLGAVPKKP